MYVEAPEIKRCCCCLPARHGILLWAYIKIGLSILAIVPLLYLIMIFVIFRVRSPDFFFIMFAVLVLVVDINMSVLALIGGHTKKVKLLEIYYKYSVVSIVLFFFMYLAILTWMLYSFSFYQNHKLRFAYFIASTVVTGFATIIVQVYMLLVLRSKLQKLGNQCEFRFVNNTTEAECKMDLEWNRQEKQKQTTKTTENGTTKDPCFKTIKESPTFEKKRIEGEEKLYKNNKYNEAMGLLK